MLISELDWLLSKNITNTAKIALHKQYQQIILIFSFRNTKFIKNKSFSMSLLISVFSLGFGIKFLIQIREKNRSPQVNVELGSHRCKFLSISNRRNFTAEPGFGFTWMPYCYSEDRCCFRFYIKKKKCYEVFCLFVCFSPHMEWKQIFRSSTFFFPRNLNSHFPTSSTITWSIWYFSANLTHVINRVSSYKMNNLYEGSESQNTASFLHEYFCASHLSHTSLLIWFLSDWELRPRVVAPIGASALPFFFPESTGGKNMTLLCWECFIIHFISALSLSLQSSKEDGNIS